MFYFAMLFWSDIVFQNHVFLEKNWNWLAFQKIKLDFYGKDKDINTFQPN